MAVFLVAWLGLPVSRPDIVPMQVIDVELETETAKLEPAKPAPPPEPTPAVAPPPPPPPPPAPEPPQPVAPPEPEPEPVVEPTPEPEPEPEVAEIPIPAAKPEPKPEPPKVVDSPRPKAKPKPKPKPQVAAKPEPKPEPKPKPQNDFASVLKTVSKLEKQAPKTEKKPEKPEKTLQQQVAEALSRSRTQEPQRQPLVSALSRSDLDAVRRQIEACWNVPAGARDAQNMTVEIRTLMNPDGRVRSASIVDTARMASDSFYRSMAESALRAVLNHRCQPLRLPLEKYDEWRVMVLNFDPRGMF